MVICEAHVAVLDIFWCELVCEI